jgi:hypothetical protein
MNTYLDLTEAETELLTQIAFGINVTPFLKRAAKLETKGLIISSEVHAMTPWGAELTFTSWQMPIDEHIRFCEWCSEQTEDD